MHAGIHVRCVCLQQHMQLQRTFLRVVPSFHEVARILQVDAYAIAARTEKVAQSQMYLMQLHVRRLLASVFLLCSLLFRCFRFLASFRAFVSSSFPLRHGTNQGIKVIAFSHWIGVIVYMQCLALIDDAVAPGEIHVRQLCTCHAQLTVIHAIIEKDSN